MLKTRPPESLWTKLLTTSDHICALEDPMYSSPGARVYCKLTTIPRTSEEMVVTDLEEMPLNEPREEPLTVDAVHPLLVPNLLDVKKGTELLVETKNTESGNTDETTCAFGMAITHVSWVVLLPRFVFRRLLRSKSINSPSAQPLPLKASVLTLMCISRKYPTMRAMTLNMPPFEIGEIPITSHSTSLGQERYGPLLFLLLQLLRSLLNSSL